MNNIKNILLLGRSGQLGREVYNIISLNVNYRIYCPSREEVDLLNLKELKLYLESKKLDLIINCAAYTDVNKAENDFEKADIINSLSTEVIALYTADNNIRLIHISTDYVFNGKSKLPYKEEDFTNPITKYGKSKLNGEKKIIHLNPKCIIIRTSWVYSIYGNNFLNKIIEMSKIKKEIKVVNDQIGCPTYAYDLAKFISNICPEFFLDKIGKNTEIFNYSNSGSTSWFGFACMITKEINSNCEIIPINSIEFKSLAERPKFSVLSNDKIYNRFGFIPPAWEKSLKKAITSKKILMEI